MKGVEDRLVLNPPGLAAGGLRWGRQLHEFIIWTQQLYERDTAIFTILSMKKPGTVCLLNNLLGNNIQS